MPPHGVANPRDNQPDPPSLPGVIGVLLVVFAVLATLYQTGLYAWHEAGLPGVTAWALLAGISLLVVEFLLNPP